MAYKQLHIPEYISVDVAIVYPFTKKWLRNMKNGLNQLHIPDRSWDGLKGSLYYNYNNNYYYYYNSCNYSCNYNYITLPQLQLQIQLQLQQLQLRLRLQLQLHYKYKYKNKYKYKYKPAGGKPRQRFGRF